MDEHRYKIRIKFAKYGSMKFLGHLDTMRYFQKALRRSGIDVAYTGGYSPHQIMAFAHPLGVGIESDSEIMDIEVNSFELIEGSMDRVSLSGEAESLDEASEPGSRTNKRTRLLSALCAQMSEGFEIADIRLLDDNASNAMASVAAASYEVSFRHPVSFKTSAASSDSANIRPDSVRCPDLTSRVSEILGSAQIIMRKKTKKKEAETDIRPGIYDLAYEDGIVRMTVDASSAGNIKPELVINALLGYDDEEGAGRNDLAIRRTEIYGRDSEGALIPLIEFGHVF